MSVPPPTVSVLPRVSPTSLEFWWSPPVLTEMVAVGNNQSGSVCIAKSTYGLTWTASTNNPFSQNDKAENGQGRGVAWNGSYWVAVGYNADRTVAIAKSPDGLTWTDSSNNPFRGGAGDGIAWNGYYWVAVGASIGATVCIAKSPDGITWTDSSNNPFSSGGGAGIAWNGSYWLAVGYNNGNTVAIAKSSDGMTWTASTDNPFSTGGGQEIAWNGSYWVAVGVNYGNNTIAIAKSLDGMIWTNASNNPFTGGQANGIAWNGSYWIAVGQNAGNTVAIAKSVDGETWVPSTNNPFSGGYGRAIAWNGSYWVAVGNINTIVRSTDGMTWTASTDDPFAGGAYIGIAGYTLPITGYRLQNASPSVTVAVGPTANTTVTGLTTLTDYSFTIQTNIGGTYSSAVPFRTVHTSGRPDPVTNLATSQSVVNGELSLTFTWTDPVDYATYHVYGLRTGVNDSIYSDLTPDLAGTITFTGLDATRVYTFHIQRGNDAGYSTAASIATTATQVFNPAAVPGLQFWVDATDTAGNGSAVADGTTVATWVDKSGKGNSATSASGATLQTDSLGRYLDFSAKTYSIPSSSWIYQQTYTIFVVDRPLNYTGTYTLVGTQAASSDMFNIRYENGIVFSNYADNQSLGTTFQTLGAPVNIWCFTNYGGKTAYWNKQISGKYNSEDSSIVDSLLSIGSIDGATSKYSGRLREILMFNGRLAEADREGVTDYLYNKWYPQTSQFPLVPVENGAILWLDAQDFKTFYTDTAGTVRGTTSIKFWKDKTGSGNDMIDASGGSLTTVNSQTAFTPVGLTQTATYLNFADATLFLVAQNTSGQGYFSHGAGLSKSGSTVSWHESPTTNNNQFTDLGSPFIFYGRMKKGQLLSGSFIDASGVQTAYTVEDLSLELGTATLKLNDVTTVKYGEVLYYNRVLSDAEVTANAAYLSAKWGIAIPATPPFSPPAAPGLKVWLDSSDPYTVFKSGNTVTAWKDRSVNGNNAVPFGSPTVNNGIVFDGSQYLKLPDSALPQETYSYYIVAKDLSNSTIVNAGSRNLVGQMWVAVGLGGNSNCIATSFNGVTWTLATVQPFTEGSASGIAWNGSYWVAVGYSSAVSIAKSPDGMTWTASSNNPFYSGYGIAWNGSYWVAVGSKFGGTVSIVKSSDGMTWTDASNNPFTDGIGFGIAWNGSYWVAVGTDNSTITIAKSPDGMTWTDSSGGGGNNPFTGGVGRGIAWNGSFWVAVGANLGGTVCIAKSTDGLSWTNASNNPFTDGTGSGIAWNGTYWVAVGNNVANTVCIAKSLDGMTWTASTNNPFPGGVGKGIAWNGSYWITVGNDGDSSVAIAKSTNGMTWTTLLTPNFTSAYGIATGIGPPHNSLVNIQTVGQYAQTSFNSDTKGLTWIAGGQGQEGGGTNPIAYSIDGVSWTPATSINLSHVNGIASNGSYWLAIGYNDAYTVSIAKSTDAITWTNASNNPFTNDIGRGIAWNGSYWVAVGSNGDSTVCIAKSPDGMTWTNSTDNPFPGGLARGIAWNGSYWITVGNNTGNTVCIAKSTNGMTWTDSSGGGGNNPFTSGTGNGIAWNGSYWVAVGNNGGATVTIAKSPDGLNWTDASNNPFTVGYGNGIAWNGTYWVAGGFGSGSSNIVRSSDGMTWTNSDNTSFTQGAKAIGWNGSYWIAVGYNTSNTVSIAKSPDGLTWTDVSDNPFTAGYGNAIAYGYRTTTSNTTTLVDTNAIPVSKTVIIESIYNGTGKRLYLSGKTGATDTSSHIQDASNNYIGWDMGSGYMNGTIKELLVYDAAHTTVQRKQVEQYLKVKWYPTTYTPADASGVLGLWLDSDLKTFNYAGTGIRTWRDKSGHADAKQDQLWAQPIYSVDPVTGKSGVQFGSDGMSTGFATMPFTNTNSWTITAVQRYDYSSDQTADLVNGLVSSAYDASGFKVGTTTTSTPNTLELALTAGTTKYATAEIHKRPVMTSQVVTDLSSNIYVNGSNTLYQLVPAWIAGGSTSVKTSISTDGMTWTDVSNTVFSAGACQGIAYNGSYWVAVGFNGDCSVCIAKSVDGANWTNSTNNPFTSATGNGKGIAWNGSYWIAVGDNGGTNSIAKSTNGLNWLSATNNPFPGGLARGIAWNGSYWLSVGYNAATALSISKSPDGMSWTNSSNNPFTGGVGNGIAWNGSYWVAVGRNGDYSITIAKSTDGMTWMDASNNPFSGSGGQANGIAWNGSYWVAVGANSTLTIAIAKSLDGMTWTDASNNPFTGREARGISWNGSYWVAVGANTDFTVAIAKSLDGMTWTDASNNPFTTGDGLAIAYGYVLLPTTTTTTLTSAITSTTPLSIGYTGTLIPSIQGAMRGYIYELVVYNSALGTSDRQAIEGYLAWKWGIQDLLATTHPYYLAPP